MIGQTLGHYRILEKRGEGGMGEVYRAEDTTLGREVAPKVLPAEFAQSQERLERFQREAKTLATLDHPNTVTIHTVEKAEGVHCLTMQLVRGERVSDLITSDGLPVDRVLGSRWSTRCAPRTKRTSSIGISSQKTSWSMRRAVRTPDGSGS